MATYVIGDIHGRFETLQALLSQLPLRTGEDHLWLTGDLVNRGPASLEVLRWARRWHQRWGERMVVVLGNHDVHLLSLHFELRPIKTKDRDLVPILEAKDRQRLLQWLLWRPLLHRRGDTVLVHAGLLPRWTPRRAERLARSTEKLLRRGEHTAALLGSKAKVDKEIREARRVLDVMTRVRTLRGNGKLDPFSGPPHEAPEGCVPWFSHPRRRPTASEIVFGHWAALGLHQEAGTYCLDSGCAWGGQLSALRLEDHAVFQQDVLEPAPSPGG